MQPTNPVSPARLPWTRPEARTLRVSITLSLISLGVWISLCYAFRTWTPDPDIVAPLVVYEGVRQHGLEFLTSWHYTQDNWLFSLVPLTSVAFSVFGTSPVVMVGFGWAIFFASVAMTAVIVSRLEGWWAAGLLASILLFANFDALGIVGFLTHPVTHNISMAWGLGVVILALRLVTRYSTLLLLAFATALFADVVSDPWAAATIAVPIIIVTAFLHLLHRRTPQGVSAAKICIAAIVSSAAAHTRFFGLLGFLPQSDLSLGSVEDVGRNLLWMGEILGVLYNIVPGGDKLARPVVVVSLLCFAAILSVSVVALLRRIKSAPIEKQFVFGVACMSILGVAAAFLISRWEPMQGMMLGRFFVNVYYFSALIVFMAASGFRGAFGRVWQTFFLAYAALFIVSGICSNPVAWANRPSVPRNEPAAELAQFLKDNGLRYGYGPYWGSYGLAMDWLTNGAITVRPVYFLGIENGISSGRSQTSDLWYSGRESAAGQPTFLLIRADGENCPDVTACVEQAQHQFGEPAKILIFKDMKVLVWPYDIATKIVHRPI